MRRAQGWPPGFKKKKKKRLVGVKKQMAISSFFSIINKPVQTGSEAEVALGKGEMGDRPRPHLKIRSHPKKF